MSVKYADDLFSARDVACDLAWLIIFLSLFTCVSVCVDLGAAIIMVIISLCAWISPWYVRLMPGLPSRVSGFSWPIATKCVGKYCGLKKANVHFLKILLQYRKHSSDFCCQCLEYCNDCVYCCSHAIFAWEHLLWMHHVYKCIIFEAKLEKHKFCHFFDWQYLLMQKNILLDWQIAFNFHISDFFMLNTKCMTHTSINEHVSSCMFARWCHGYRAAHARCI